jgi:predicted GTPase
MKGSLEILRNNIIEVQGIVKEGHFLTLNSEKRKGMLSESGKLIEKINSIEEQSLMVGLLGGTGVGKSSLMNAVAGTPVSSASHLRPHTDDVLIYRHEEVPVPASLPLSGIPWREFTHNISSVRQMLICDLPDFDSLVGEHQKKVVHFLEHLDILVWVTSPEKYGDGRFYEFLRLVSRSKENFYFVINKADVLFEGKSKEQGLEELSTVMNRLQGYLKENGIITPPLYAVSAREAIDSGNLAYWNQFPSLRQEIYRQRNYKEIKNIKASNLDSEFDMILSSFEEELSYRDSLHAILKDMISEFKEGRRKKTHNFRNSLDLWSERISSNLPEPHIGVLSFLVGPSYGFASLAAEWHKLAKKNDEEEGLEAAADEVTAIFHQHLEWQDDRTSGNLLRKGFSSAAADTLKGIINIEKEREDCVARIKSVLTRPGNPFSKSSRFLFRGLQYIVYGLVFVILIFSLAGEGIWQNLLENPGMRSFLNFSIKILYALFSPAGIAALGSYILINAFLGYRFYRMYRRLVEKYNARHIRSLQKKFEDIWNEKMDIIYKRLEEYDEQICSGISLISGFKRR